MTMHVPSELRSITCSPGFASGSCSSAALGALDATVGVLVAAALGAGVLVTTVFDAESTVGGGGFEMGGWRSPEQPTANAAVATMGEASANVLDRRAGIEGGYGNSVGENKWRGDPQDPHLSGPAV